MVQKLIRCIVEVSFNFSFYFNAGNFNAGKHVFSSQEKSVCKYAEHPILAD